MNTDNREETKVNRELKNGGGPHAIGPGNLDTNGSSFLVYPQEHKDFSDAMGSYQNGDNSPNKPMPEAERVWLLYKL